MTRGTPTSTTQAPPRRRTRSATRQSGFALVAVLWVIVGAAALGLTVSLAGREALATTHNRIHAMKAAWQAEDCIERVRSVIADLLVSESADDPGELDGWNRLDRLAPHHSLIAHSGCRLELRPSGTTIDVNTATSRTLHRILEVHGIPPTNADSLVAALLDWRDPDRIPRPNGAEIPDYEAAGMHPPRDGPLAGVRELRRVRGWDGLPLDEGLFGVEEERICLNHAPLPVLRTLPGFLDETVARVAERRLRDAPISGLHALAGELSALARDSLYAHYAELAIATTTDVAAWSVRAYGVSGSPAVTVVLEVRLVPVGTRAAVVRRRSWIA